MDDTTNANMTQGNEVGSGSRQKKRTMGLSDSEYDKLVELVESAFDEKRVFKGSPMTCEWPIIVQKFVDQLGKERPLKILQTAWKKLKEKWRKYHELHHRSVFGWNEETKMLEAEDVIWDSVISENSKYQVCCRKSFKYYDIMIKICQKSTKVGQSAHVRRRLPHGSHPSNEEIEVEEEEQDTTRVVNDAPTSFNQVPTSSSSSRKRKRSASSVSLDRLQIQEKYTEACIEKNQLLSRSDDNMQKCMLKINNISNISATAIIAMGAFAASSDNNKIIILNVERVVLTKLVEYIVSQNPVFCNEPVWDPPPQPPADLN
ncbi:hypothetical protein AXF42_Ash017728 [Apostasia shenzhenica]|uniref:Myb/SANT-like domain-containing protein n=1 Tax=Apostasia shenzhenica TaxID=1088818 RepID=A0A2I0B655_9ASPA|nr:hypothetical protein AXF42_Ash017728 [Apostasia shenzhenica]